jgi:hypothetical protein
VLVGTADLRFNSPERANHALPSPPNG